MGIKDIFSSKKSGVEKGPGYMGPEIFLQKTRAHLEPDGKNYEVVCPYCLSKFHVWDLQFRSASNTDTVEESGIQRAYPLEEDEKYASFWQEMNMPVADAMKPFILKLDDTENVRAVQLWDSDQWLDMSNREVRAMVQEQAICRVKDKFGGISKERICPHCHNTLPEVIGRYPNYIFSMIGNTSSGKTVYLQRLKSCLMNNVLLPQRQMALQLLSESNLNVAMESKRMFEETADMKQKLSDATSVGYMHPVILELIRGEEHILVTLFDFPGEAIWEENRTAFFSTLMQKNGENTDGWLFMLDSTMLSSVRSCIQSYHEEDLLSVKDKNDPQQNAEPAYIVSQFTKAYGLGNRVQCPVAFTLSKSDVIRYFAQKCEASTLSGLTGTEMFMQLDLNNDRDKVDLDELYQCHSELKRFLKGDLVLNYTGSCPQHAWFAVSATGVEVRNGILEAKAPACRVVDPLEWLLWMVGAVPGVAFKSKDWARSLGGMTPGRKA